MNKFFSYTSLSLLIAFTALIAGCDSEVDVRQDILLHQDWKMAMNDSNKNAHDGFENLDYTIEEWQKVTIPHNWDDYGGYRRLTHGNLHGYAWYKRSFQLDQSESAGKRYFLFFEGVGSYATVWVNGKEVGSHAGGRTSFTLDITDAIKLKSKNSLAVRADHPADIRDLPWVCGGCSPEWGFSEGSQPLGIFRPVHLVITNEVRVEPFGVHVWNGKLSKDQAELKISVEVKNYGTDEKNVQIVHKLLDAEGRLVVETAAERTLSPGTIDTLVQEFPGIKNPQLWSVQSPYLYNVETEILENGKVIDRVGNSYGIRWIKWDISGENCSNRFYLNDEPVFINGTAEYEHILGQGHAFSNEQIKARIAQIRAMGFNSFRDAHQPHNFTYHEAWDSLGLLWWPQMGAHIWFDTPEFRSNFKTLLHDWVKERRNSPSVILWGLENESTLPTDFAEECAELIRKMDPTSSSQRLITTCNGGSGTDWNVIQNWSGTYGGNPWIYDEEISKQLLNGEYGAWRSIDLHSEGEFDAKGPLSEDRMTLLMESKVHLAEKAKDQCCGQYHWLFNSHDNPGRTQAGEGLRDLDRVGPVNYKGTVTIWGEPLDVFYMFRSNYAHKIREPMLYIASHTWPDRWTEPGVKNGIRIYSNCDEVELFNGIKKNSLGRKKRGEIGTHFKFDGVNIQTNVLSAIGYVNGKEVASDVIVLHHLPEDKELGLLQGETVPLQDLDEKENVIYRVNCGGADYVDQQGNRWMADVHKTGEETWGSLSWTDDYQGLPAFYGSQRQTWDPIGGTKDWPLIQTFRYGRHKLNYQFPVPDGDYQVELYFVEPWYGTGGGMDCKAWRLFDVAINDLLVINDLDIWSEVGHDQLLKKTIHASVSGGMLKISFPEVKAGQALVSAIAISTHDMDVKPAPSSSGLLENLKASQGWSFETWLSTGMKVFSGSDEIFAALPPVLYGAEWLKAPVNITQRGNGELVSFQLSADADVHIGLEASVTKTPEWLASFIATDMTIETVLKGSKSYKLYQKKFLKGDVIRLKSGLENMLVAAVPVSSLDKPIDLRPSVRYQAEDGELYGQSKQVDFMKKSCVHVSGQKSGIGFVFQVGLASKYGLEFRYMNMSDHAVEADVEIRAADNRLMWSGIWSFLPANVKWQSLRTNTQTTINAGTYTIKISPKENVPFYFDWVKVQ